MTDTLEADIPEAEEAIQETRTPEQRRDALLQDRIDKATGSKDEVEPEAPETEEEEDDEEEDVDTTETEDEEEESEGESEDVLSDDGGFDIEDLNEEELEALTNQINTKAGKALTKSRLDKKEDKAKIASQQAQIDELSANVVTSDNPFANIRSVEKADSEIKQTEINIKGWNRKLITDRVEQYNEKTGEDESGVMFGTQFMSVNQLLNAIDKEEEKLEPLRNRKSEIKKVSETLGDTDGVIGEVRGKLGIEDDSDEAKEYEALLANPKFELVKNILPEYARELIGILGRAAVTKVPAKKKAFSKKLKRKAPKSNTTNVSLDTNAGRSPKRSDSSSVQVKKLQKIISDPRQTIAARRDADQQIRILNRS
tara:strand:- start:1464 stop:2570 length:1107 start_codon:yes stop_codon:yes gene_type:complete